MTSHTGKSEALPPMNNDKAFDAVWLAARGLPTAQKQQLWETIQVLLSEERRKVVEECVNAIDDEENYREPVESHAAFAYEMSRQVIRSLSNSHKGHE